MYITHLFKDKGFVRTQTFNKNVDVKEFLKSSSFILSKHHCSKNALQVGWVL